MKTELNLLDLEDYISDNYDYNDNITVDFYTIEDDKITVEWVFRDEEIEDWEEYEEMGFPYDVDKLTFSLQDFQDYIRS